MSSGQPPTGPSALRIGGFALLGVGVLAAVFGLGTLLAGDPRNVAGTTDPPAATSRPTAKETTSAAAPGATTGETSQAPTSSPSESRSPATTTVAPTSPGRSPSPGAPGGGKTGTAPDRDVPRRPIGGKGAAEPIVLRVYNNSNIRGLAHRAAEDFREAGFRVSEIGNYSGGRIPTTTVYYRPGTEEKRGARVVAERFGARLKPRFPGIEDASPGIIVILTKYYNGPAEGPVE